MKKQQSTSRRSFIRQTAAAGGALLLPGSALAQGLQHGDLYKAAEMPASSPEVLPGSDDLEIHIFSKHLQFLDYREMSEVVSDMGFDGIDLTIRPKGHVLPERVEEDLPRATKAMRSFDLIPRMFASKISDAADSLSARVLKCAVEEGFEFYRPAWYRYKKDGDILATQQNAKKQLRGLAELNKEVGITGSYHNHSGNFVGGSLWDLYEIIEGLMPQMGCQFDIMHANVEGGRNWTQGLSLIQPSVNTLVFKDFKWVQENGEWRVQMTPMGQGMVDFKKYFSLLKKYRIRVPVSIHVEYDLGGAEHGREPDIPYKEVYQKIKADLDFVRKTWAEAKAAS